MFCFTLNIKNYWRRKSLPFVLSLTLLAWCLPCSVEHCRQHLPVFFVVWLQCRFSQWEAPAGLQGHLQWLFPGSCCLQKGLLWSYYPLVTLSRATVMPSFLPLSQHWGGIKVYLPFCLKVALYPLSSHLCSSLGIQSRTLNQASTPHRAVCWVPIMCMATSGIKFSHLNL